MTNPTRGEKLAVLGGGAWGTALSCVLARNEQKPVLWARCQKTVVEINHENKNTSYLPSINLPHNIRASFDIHEALEGAKAVFLVVPAQALRGFLKQVGALIPLVPLVLCCKGIEQETGFLPHQIVQEILPNHAIAVLSGPTFAKEVALDLPTAVSLASKDVEVGTFLQSFIMRPTFRTYLLQDIVGVEVAGAVKNVMAIACGIALGQNLGDNAQAALLTRGLFETGVLIQAFGGDKTTLLGLAGVGDLTLTCHSLTSRNTALGYAIGKGKGLKEALASSKGVAEGVWTSKALYSVLKRRSISMPIVETVYGILHEGLPLEQGIHQLLGRPKRSYFLSF